MYKMKFDFILFGEENQIAVARPYNQKYQDIYENIKKIDSEKGLLINFDSLEEMQKVKHAVRQHLYRCYPYKYNIREQTGKLNIIIYLKRV